MRRTCALVALVFVTVGLGALFVRPQISASAVDRAVRALALIDPDLGRRLRENQAAPLEARLAARGFGLGDAAFIRIFKEEHQLELWLGRKNSFALFETYPICSWSGALGPKIREGDGQSPEGFYAVGLKQLNPNSAYYLAFDLGFPNAYDRVHGRTGSYLMVHGDCLSVGCYAMRDGGIDEIYRVVEAALRAGQREVPVHAFPFRLSGEALAKRSQHAAAAEWAGLKEGYDLFEATKAPPAVAICGGRYSFGPPPAGCTPVTAW